MSIHPRVQAGTPSGGQFAAVHHTEGQISLSGAGSQSGLPEPSSDIQQAYYNRYAAAYGWSDWPTSAERDNFAKGLDQGFSMAWARPADVRAGDTIVHRNTVLDVAQIMPPRPDAQPGVVTVMAKVRDAKVRGKTAGTVDLMPEAHVSLVESTDEERAERAVSLAGTTPTELAARPAHRDAAPDRPYDDKIIGGRTPADIRRHFGFAHLPDETRNRSTIGGPFSIVARTVDKVPMFEVTDQRTGVRLQVGSKRSATRVAKQIEDDYFGKRWPDEETAAGS